MNTKNLKLFMLLLGGKPEGRHTEQHDVLFTIAPDFAATETDARAFWPEAPKIHVDAWREVTRQDGYWISVIPKKSADQKDALKLFFINLGGYKPNEFEEFHYKMIIVAKSMDEAIRSAKTSAFFLHHPGPSKNALPHVDDKYGIDVDDAYNVEDILPMYLREQYTLLIEDPAFDEDVSKDAIHLGYQKYEKNK